MTTQQKFHISWYNSSYDIVNGTYGPLPNRKTMTHINIFQGCINQNLLIE